MKPHLLKDIADRRIFRYVVAYVAAAWAVLGVVDQLADNSILPRFLYPATLTFLVSGFPGALIASWFHGAKGRQSISKLERMLLAAVGVLAILTTSFVVRAELAGSATAAKASDLAPEDDLSRLAVLYFEPRGGEEAQFLAAGLTEALISVLSEVRGLHVISRNGSQLFRGAAAASDTIGRTLQVGTIVTGTVAQAGDRVRVDINLTQSKTMKQFATTRLERPRAEIFALQDELADTVAVFLRKRIGAELGNLKLRRGTTSVDAWELVQQSSQRASGTETFLRSRDLDGASKALLEADSLLALAESADPKWIEPVIRRGWLAYRQSRLGGTNREQYEKWIGQGLDHAERALQLDQANGGALELRALLIYWKYILNLAGKPEEAARLAAEAEAGFRAAVAADSLPRPFALTSLSHLQIGKGDFTEAKLNALRAYEADPFLENANLTIWRVFLASWNLEDAVESRRYCQEGVRRFPDDHRFRQCQLMVYALPGDAPDFARAWALVSEFAELSPPQVREVNHQRGIGYVAMALARAGMVDSARAVLRKVRAGPDIDPLREVAILESIAYAWIGDRENAVRQLAAYFAANPREVDGYRDDAQRGQLVWFHKSLIEEPRFRALLGLR